MTGHVANHGRRHGSRTYAISVDLEGGCPHCKKSLSLLAYHPGGGSAYFVFRCDRCEKTYDWDTYCFELKERAVDFYAPAAAVQPVPLSVGAPCRVLARSEPNCQAGDIRPGDRVVARCDMRDGWWSVERADGARGAFRWNDLVVLAVRQEAP